MQRNRFPNLGHSQVFNEFYTPKNVVPFSRSRQRIFVSKWSKRCPKRGSALDVDLAVSPILLRHFGVLMAYQPHRRVARPPGNVVPRFGDPQLFPVAVRVRHLRKHGSVFRKAKSAFPFVESVTAGSRFVIAQWALPPGRGGSAR